MCMTQRRNRYARPEVEVTLIFLVEQIWPFATFERDVRPVIGRKKGRNHDKLLWAGKTKTRLIEFEGAKLKPEVSSYGDLLCRGTAQIAFSPLIYRNYAFPKPATTSCRPIG